MTRKKKVSLSRRVRVVMVVLEGGRGRGDEKERRRPAQEMKESSSELAHTGSDDCCVDQ